MIEFILAKNLIEARKIIFANLDERKTIFLEHQRKIVAKQLFEKLSPSMGVKTYIDDFIKSDDPRFKGKSKKKRIKMALGAYYSAKKENNEN